VKFLQTLEILATWRHTLSVGRLLHRIRTRRRERRLLREVELRFRRQLDARAEAAARLVDDLRQD
jgi:hypothetical protein